METNERLELVARAEAIVRDAQRDEGITLHPFIVGALVASVRHGLTAPGVYRLVEALANVEREAGRLPPKSSSLDLSE